MRVRDIDAYRKQLVIKKRSPEEWIQDNNLEILGGIALNCLTYKELAACIGITDRQLFNWRKDYPEIAEAVELGRGEADAIILRTGFEQAARGEPQAVERWFKYRLNTGRIKNQEDDDREKGIAENTAKVTDAIAEALRTATTGDKVPPNADG